MKRIGSAVLWALLTWTAASAASPGGSFVRTGRAVLWYEIRGSGDGTPLVVINGGPSVSHEYMLVSDVWDTFARGRGI